MANLFDNISVKNKEKILYTLEANTFTLAKNVSILNTIIDDNFIGYVEKGYMQIIRTDYNGNATIIEELEENSVFGSVISSLNNSEYNIITKEETKIVVIDYNRIITEENTKNPKFNQFIKNVLEIVTDKINEKNERINILTKKSIRDKLLEYFKIKSNKNGSKIIYLSFTYTELALYLAVDRSSLMREIKNLKDEGFIKSDNRRITLLY